MQLLTDQPQLTATKLHDSNVQTRCIPAKLHNGTNLVRRSRAAKKRKTKTPTMSARADHDAEVPGSGIVHFFLVPSRSNDGSVQSHLHGRSDPYTPSRWNTHRVVTVLESTHCHLRMREGKESRKGLPTEKKKVFRAANTKFSEREGVITLALCPIHLRRSAPIIEQATVALAKAAFSIATLSNGSYNADD